MFVGVESENGVSRHDPAFYLTIHFRYSASASASGFFIAAAVLLLKTMDHPLNFSTAVF